MSLCLLFAGLCLGQLTASRETVSVFVRLSDDLQQLLLDIRTGHVLEFPLVHAEAVYTLQRRRIPVSSGAPSNPTQFAAAAAAAAPVPKAIRQQCPFNTPQQQQQQQQQKQQQLPPLDIGRLREGSIPRSFAVPSGPLLLNKERRDSHHERDDRRRTAAAAAAQDSSSSSSSKDASKQNYIVVIEFGSRKLAFAFHDRINAETFQIATGLLARRVRDSCEETERDRGR